MLRSRPALGLGRGQRKSLPRPALELGFRGPYKKELSGRDSKSEIGAAHSSCGGSRGTPSSDSVTRSRALSAGSSSSQSYG